MAGLLYKEFLVNRRNLIPVGGSLLLISVLMFIKAPDGFEIFYSFMGIFVYLLIFFLTGEMLQASVFEPDETKRWANFILSSPLGAAGQVKSKYIFVFLTSFAVFNWCFLIDSVSSAVNNSTSSTYLLLILFFLQIIMRALEIPFVVRYGSKNGAKYKGCIFAAIILAVIIYMLFGYIPRFMSAEHFFEWYENMMNSTTNGVLIFIAVLPYISLALYCISYRISCGLYQKGVDTYDK